MKFRALLRHELHRLVPPQFHLNLTACETAPDIGEISILWLVDKLKPWHSGFSDKSIRCWMLLCEQSKFNFWCLLIWIPREEKHILKRASVIPLPVSVFGHCLQFSAVCSHLLCLLLINVLYLQYCMAPQAWLWHVRHRRFGICLYPNSWLILFYVMYVFREVIFSSGCGQLWIFKCFAHTSSLEKWISNTKK